MDDKTKLANLREEWDVIEHSNQMYLDRQAPSEAATAEYRQRLERLVQVRQDMKDLAKAIAAQD